MLLEKQMLEFAIRRLAAYELVTFAEDFLEAVLVVAVDVIKGTTHVSVYLKVVGKLLVKAKHIELTTDVPPQHTASVFAFHDCTGCCITDQADAA